MVDVETTGPVPSLSSMFWFGAVIVEPGLEHSFEGRLCPLPEHLPSLRDDNIGLHLSRKTVQEVRTWSDPEETMRVFEAWLQMQSIARKDERILLLSDNNGFDAMFMSWYFYRFVGRNPFGHSSMNIGSLYKGIVRNMRHNFKHLRKTQHTHNPVDDARGNAEAFLTFTRLMQGTS